MPVFSELDDLAKETARVNGATLLLVGCNKT